MESLKVGLCSGRHEIRGITEYIFASVPNPADVDAINRRACEWVEANIPTRISYCAGLNQIDDTDVAHVVGDARLVIYVTGLTVALCAVLRACARRGVSVVLMHYDRDTNSYLPQKMW